MLPWKSLLLMLWNDGRRGRSEGRKATGNVRTQRGAVCLPCVHHPQWHWEAVPATHTLTPQTTEGTML
jgi:hypothetical protein